MHVHLRSRHLPSEAVVDDVPRARKPQHQSLQDVQKGVSRATKGTHGHTARGWRGCGGCFALTLHLAFSGFMATMPRRRDLFNLHWAIVAVGVRGSLLRSRRNLPDEGPAAAVECWESAGAGLVCGADTHRQCEKSSFLIMRISDLVKA